MVDAVLKLYDKYLEPDDLVGYYGLGDGWIFDVQPKGDDDTTAAALRQQIVDSVEKRGALYLPISPYISLGQVTLTLTLTPALTLSRRARGLLLDGDVRRAPVRARRRRLLQVARGAHGHG